MLYALLLQNTKENRPDVLGPLTLDQRQAVVLTALRTQEQDAEILLDNMKQRFSRWARLQKAAARCRHAGVLLVAGNIAAPGYIAAHSMLGAPRWSMTDLSCRDINRGAYCFIGWMDPCPLHPPAGSVTWAASGPYQLTSAGRLQGQLVPGLAARFGPNVHLLCNIGHVSCTPPLWGCLVLAAH